MARAKTRTWLSLDRFAEITGLNPLHFNQLHGQGLLNYELACGSPWFQEDYQKTEQVSRETLAEAIKNAEDKIALHAGFNLIPDWNTQPIRVKTIRLRDDGLLANIWNARGMQRAIELPKGYYIGGGKRAKSLIQAGVAVVITDPDGDGFSELCTVTVVTAVTNCEIRVFLPGRSGLDEYEVRPITVTSAAGTATITFKRWQIVDPDVQDGLKPEALDATVAANFETTVDIYRVYNDPSVQATLYWEPDTCNISFTTQNAMLAARDNKLGIVTYRPATYSAVTGQFTLASLTTARDPDFLDVYFCSGFEWEHSTCSYQMDPYWEKAIAHFAISEIDRVLASCNNTEWMFKKWRTDMAEVNEVRSFNVNPTDLSNPFGTRWGAIDAWKRVKARAL